ncbi:hypothetical protein FOPG_17806 [Fusarium oxysporum f. sp. conglutinans race 2 54008]|uniref:Uncharacterized protein n=1 Tax=Fusarium oxysporum f. sp. conglutinans race 2 54008 TaxID=1089457 RepID=X0GQV9_FUSOX|nr:hypothetical protein FOPG_17806 [Fusarium oxysporum f. sp. conglutinans race 2 54008]
MNGTTTPSRKDCLVRATGSSTDPCFSAGSRRSFPPGQSYCGSTGLRGLGRRFCVLRSFKISRVRPTRLWLNNLGLPSTRPSRISSSHPISKAAKTPT